MPYHTLDQLKSKLRQLKKLETNLRAPASGNGREGIRLVWDVFFSTRCLDDPHVKYPLRRLLDMNREEYKAVVEEFFYRLYFHNMSANVFSKVDVYDPQLLGLLDLPPYAGIDEIKKRFRELAKKYHPDLGGDSEKFLELMQVYENLIQDR
ncbi:MAG TPA: DnaJ domain-containing protein [Anaerolineaceae bacterium]